MKIVINKCFGGFGLSRAAEKQLIGKCNHIELMEPVEYYNGSKNIGWEDRYQVDQVRSQKDQEWYTWFYNDKVVCDNHRDRENRTCPALIKVVKEMGKAASG